MDGASQTEGTRDGVSSSVDGIIAGNDSKDPGQGEKDGKSTSQDPREVAAQGVAPQPQPWRGMGSDDPNQPQPQPWNPTPDPSDPNNQKR